MPVTRKQLLIGVLIAVITALFLDAPVQRVFVTMPVFVVDIGRVLELLGDGGWMVYAFLMTAFVSGLLSQTATQADTRANATLILRVVVLISVTLVLSGVVVQIVKHTIGRARPVHLEALGAYAFQPFKFDYSFNSFPSGHSTTVAALAVILAWLFPRWAVGFAMLAILGGLSRIATGRHYLSDVIAGLGFGAVFAKSMVNLAVAKGFLPNRENVQYGLVAQALANWVRTAMRAGFPVRSDQGAGMDPGLVRSVIILLGLMVVSLVLFLSFPGFDIWVSALFWTPETGFSLAKSQSLETVRWVYRGATYLVVFLALLMLAVRLRLGGECAISGQVWAFVVACFLIGPGLIANWFLKDHWGRARPADIMYFGGESTFTLPFEITDQCARNCSFVSGEASSIAMVGLVIVILGISWVRLKPLLWFGVGGAVVAFGIGLRIATGRHFISDTVFAVLIMGLIAALFYWLFDIKRHRNTISVLAIKQDTRRVWAYLSGGANADVTALGDVKSCGSGVAEVGRSFAALFRIVYRRATAFLPVR